MRPVSSEFLAAVRGSHRMVADARVLTSYQEGVNPTGESIVILNGNVTLNGSSDIRSSVTMRTDGNRAWADETADLLTPYGNELFVRRGIDFGNGTVEWVSQGYFRLYDVEQTRAPNGPITLLGYDRMIGIREARLTRPIQFPAGTLLETVVDTLVLEVYPDATIEWDDSTGSTALTREQTAIDDRYKFLEELVTSYSKIMYFDHRGILVIKTQPSDTTPIFNVNSGKDGVLIDLARSRSREGVYNAVVVNGESADTLAPARAVVEDLDTTSPTYWNGRFGKVPRFYSSTFITTDTQANATARALLERSIGLPYSVSFNAVPNPALEPYDPIGVITPQDQERHVIDTLVIPLVSSEPMRGTTRLRERTPL